MNEIKALAASASWDRAIAEAPKCTTHWATDYSTLDMVECQCSIGHDHAV